MYTTKIVKEVTLEEFKDIISKYANNIRNKRFKAGDNNVYKYRLYT